jgi:hypothetical protein
MTAARTPCPTSKPRTRPPVRARGHHLEDLRRPAVLLPARGLPEEEAVALIVNGFVKDVIQQLPMEFAVEAQKLIGISLEGSVNLHGCAVIVITHYQRLLEHIVPDTVHVLYKGQVIKSGTKDLALDLEANGYAGIIEAAA